MVRRGRRWSRIATACQNCSSVYNEFLLAGSWSDAPERCRSLTYDQAEELYNDGKYRDAQSLYASIPDYQDANRKEQACRYRLAGKAADDQE